MRGTFTNHFIQRFRYTFVTLISTVFRELNIIYVTELGPVRTAVRGVYIIHVAVGTRMYASILLKSRPQLVIAVLFTMKRSATSASHMDVEPEPEGEVKRKVVSLKTFQKWCIEMDQELKTISWLSSSEAIEKYFVPSRTFVFSTSKQWKSRTCFFSNEEIRDLYYQMKHWMTVF